MALLTIVSRVFGLLRILVISAFFGTSSSADILNLVMSVPNNLRKIFAEGGLSNAYMSVFGTSIKDIQRSSVTSQRFFSELLWYVGLTSLLCSILLFLNTSVLTRFLFQWNTSEEGMVASRLLSILVLFLFFITINVVFSGLLQSHKKFALVALSPVFHSLSVIAFVLFFHRSLGIYAVAIGLVLGVFIQCVVLSVSLSSLKYHVLPRPTFRLSPEMRIVIKRYLPSVLAIVVVVINQQILFYFSSTLEVGSSSSFAYALVFFQLPIGVFINAINSVAFVYLVQFFEKKDIVQFKSCMLNTFNNLSITSIPISILFFFFSHAGVAIALQRGALDSEAAFLIARILRGYAIGIPITALYLFFQKALYAIHRHRTVLLYTLLFCGIDLILTLILIRTNLRIVGVSYAYSVSLLLVLPFMYLSLRKFIQIGKAARFLLRVLIACLPLAVFSVLLSSATSDLWFSGPSFSNIIRFVIITAFAFGLLLLGSKSVKIDIIGVFKKNKP